VWLSVPITVNSGSGGEARHVSALAGPVGAVLCGVLLFLCSERHTKTAKGVARTEAGDVYTLKAVSFPARDTLQR